MTTHLKKRQLHSYALELDDYAARGSVFGYLFAGRINDFYKMHNAHLEKIGNEITMLQKAFYMWTEDGKDMIRHTEEGPLKGKPILKEGRKQEDLDMLFKELMAQDIAERFKLPEEFGPKSKLVVVEKAEARKEEEPANEDKPVDVMTDAVVEEEAKDEPVVEGESEDADQKKEG